jgi:hypothetical protein
VREIRDEIGVRVNKLLAELDSEPGSTRAAEYDRRRS